MKNTDIAMIIFISAISVVVSYFVSNAILGDPSDKVETVKYMDVVSNDIDMPDSETFNTKANNPTVEVYVGRCGPLEVWNPTKLVCEPADGSDDTDNGGGKTEDDTDSDDTENNDESNSDDSDSGESDGDSTTPTGDE